jgi:hypothetical protein
MHFFPPIFLHNPFLYLLCFSALPGECDEEDNAERGDNQGRRRDIQPVGKEDSKHAGKKSYGPAGKKYLRGFPGVKPSNEGRDDKKGKDLEYPGDLNRADEDKCKTQKEKELPDKPVLSPIRETKKFLSKDELKYPDYGIEHECLKDVFGCQPQDIAVHNGLELLKAMRRSIQDQDAGR